MGQFASVLEAEKICGISDSTIRKGIIEGKIVFKPKSADQKKSTVDIDSVNKYKETRTRATGKGSGRIGKKTHPKVSTRKKPVQEPETDLSADLSIRDRVKALFSKVAQDNLSKDMTFTAKTVLNLWDEVDDVLLSLEH